MEAEFFIERHGFKWGYTLKFPVACNEYGISERFNRYHGFGDSPMECFLCMVWHVGWINAVLEGNQPACECCGVKKSGVNEFNQFRKQLREMLKGAK
jgi:hypothetical protein